MGIGDYLTIGKPDEKKTITIETNPIDAVAHAYRLWQKYDHVNCNYKQVLNEAERIVAPLDAILPETIGDEYIQAIQTIDRKLHTGLFYTALLNIGKQQRRLHITIPHVALLGYGLRKGTMEVHAYTTEVGEYATGGCIIAHEWVLGAGIKSHNTLYVAYKGIQYPQEGGCNNIFIIHNRFILGHTHNLYIILLEKCARIYSDEHAAYVGKPGLIVRIDELVGRLCPKWVQKRAKLQKLVRNVRVATQNGIEVNEDIVRNLSKNIGNLCR